MRRLRVTKYENGKPVWEKDGDYNWQSPYHQRVGSTSCFGAHILGPLNDSQIAYYASQGKYDHLKSPKPRFKL